jgi:glyoxylase-like metal-dependent hydrolase (beta-lactamase superfamily II)
MPEMERKPYETVPAGGKAWSIEDNGVRALLFEGEKTALLVDTGFGAGGSLKAVTEQLTDRPVTVVNTHADPDHTGCNAEFGTVLMHPAEFSAYHARKPGMPVAPLWEGDVIDLGGRSFEVIHIPGHTPGSIALLDRANRLLLAGDSVSRAPIFMFGEGRSLLAHRESMRKLLGMEDAFDICWAAHGPMEVEKEQIRRLIEAAGMIMDGKVEGKEPPMPIPAKEYAWSGAAFFCSSTQL